MIREEITLREERGVKKKKVGGGGGGGGKGGFGVWGLGSNTFP